MGYTKDMDLYTAIVRFPTLYGAKFENVEEVDVYARNLKEARAAVAEKLAVEYEPGGKIVDVFRQTNVVYLG